LCHQIKTRGKLKMAIEGVDTKRDKFKRKELQETIAPMVSMISHQHAHDSANAPKSPVLMRHKKFKKATGDLFQAREQHDARLNMKFVHEAVSTKRQHILTQMKERHASFAHSKQQRGAPVPAASMGGPGAVLAMQEFWHAQYAMVQARNRVLAHQSYTLHQEEHLQLARRSLWRERSATNIMSCLTDAPRQRTLRHWNMPLPYHHSAAGGGTQQLYPVDGVQQGPSAMPASVRGAGSCTPSVVHSQGYADHVVVRDTTNQALFQGILKKQALKQEVERIFERDRQLAEAHAAVDNSIYC
jgi:hypothetical protein